MRSFLIVSVLLANSPSQAAVPLEQQLQRYERYFDAALAAVLDGKIPPHAKVNAKGGIVLGLIGISAARLEAVEVRRGMEQRFVGHRVSGHLGLVAVGPFSERMTYFKVDGSAEPAVGELLPGRMTRSTTDGLFSTERVSLGRQGRLLGAGKSLQPGIRAFSGMELSFPRFRQTSEHNQSGEMKRALSKGRALSRAASERLAQGDRDGAHQLLTQLASLRQQVVEEKKELFEAYRRSHDEHYVIGPLAKPRRSRIASKLRGLTLRRR